MTYTHTEEPTELELIAHAEEAAEERLAVYLERLSIIRQSVAKAFEAAVQQAGFQDYCDEESITAQFDEIITDEFWETTNELEIKAGLR
jgi:hypothetical protein